MSWTAEGVLNRNQPWQNWRPRFVALRGEDVCIFDKPPVREVKYSYTAGCLQGRQPLYVVMSTSQLSISLVPVEAVRLGVDHGRQRRRLLPSADLQGIRVHVPGHPRERERGRATALLHHSGGRARIALLFCGDSRRVAKVRERLAQGSLLYRQSTTGEIVRKYRYKLLTYTVCTVYNTCT